MDHPKPSQKKVSRRTALKGLLAAGAALPLSGNAFSPAMAPEPDVPKRPAPFPPKTVLLPDDDQFLDEMQAANFCFFWEQGNPQTGLIKDRCNARTPGADTSIVASIAATGFGLTAMAIGDKRGYIPTNDARVRVISTLRSLWKKLPNHRGFFYHFANINTGDRIWDSEISSVDTAILLCGVLVCREHFRDPDITQLANLIFNRVDWTWLSEDTALVTHGWSPEVGFLPSRWDYYSELMMIYLLGMGSPTHSLSSRTWHAWKRTIFEYDGLRYVGSFAPLFVHQYSQGWFDFRGKHDEHTNYFQNSIIATDVHRRFCLELSKQYSSYSDDLWGITASDSQNGYVVWGGPPAMGPIDGSVVPSAAAGSLPFLPQPVMRVLRNMRTRYTQSWTSYGFVNAFNPLKNWYDTDVVGIDTGISMIMAENVRTSFIWDTFMKSEEAQRGMERAGFEADEK
ncbi:MAG TPA: glucoamylase family protein [Terriglobales bacterium]|nr:glucoamylase family protein [Terriglobales bacterium]